jgi:hypothetical protein
MSTGPLQKQGNQLLKLHQFVFLMFALGNILAKTYFGGNSVTQFNNQNVSKSNPDDTNLRLLPNVIS